MWCVTWQQPNVLRLGIPNYCISLLLLSCSHFETAANDVLSLYERITGEQLDMTISADTTQDDEC